MTTTTYYKTLGAGHRSCHGGNAVWTPGEWMPRVNNLIPRAHGYHVLRPDQILDWLSVDLWECEIDPVGMIVLDEKCIVHTARITRRVTGWNDRTARLFAAACAERVVHLVPDELRVAADWAIGCARRYANGEATADERHAALAAAGGAAGGDALAAAGGDAGGDAGGAAGGAAWGAALAAALGAAWGAALLAARAAAGGDALGSAWGAARLAAWGAERAYQLRLFWNIVETGGK